MGSCRNARAPPLAVAARAPAQAQRIARPTPPIRGPPLQARDPLRRGCRTRTARSDSGAARPVQTGSARSEATYASVSLRLTELRLRTNVTLPNDRSRPVGATARGALSAPGQLHVGIRPTVFVIHRRAAHHNDAGGPAVGRAARPPRAARNGVAP